MSQEDEDKRDWMKYLKEFEKEGDQREKRRLLYLYEQSKIIPKQHKGFVRAAWKEGLIKVFFSRKYRRPAAKLSFKGLRFLDLPLMLD